MTLCRASALMSEEEPGQGHRQAGAKARLRLNVLACESPMWLWSSCPEASQSQLKPVLFPTPSWLFGTEV